MNLSFNCGCEENCTCNCCTPLRFQARDVCQISQEKPCISGSPRKDDDCRIATHTIQGDIFRSFIIFSGATNQVVFEDYTNNHNKTLLTLRSLDTTGSAAVPLTVTITTRNPKKTIIETIPGARTRSFQVENLESITVANSAAINGTLGVLMQKTFCISCSGQADQIDTHTIDGSETFLEFPVSTRTTEQVVFQDYTCNHNKTLIQVRSAQLAGEPNAVPLPIEINTRSGLEINVVIPALGTRAFQVEDFESLKVSNPGGEAFGQLSVLIQKTFCICCDGNTSLDCKNKRC